MTDGTADLSQPLHQSQRIQPRQHRPPEASPREPAPVRPPQPTREPKRGEHDGFFEQARFRSTTGDSTTDYRSGIALGRSAPAVGYLSHAGGSPGASQTRQPPARTRTTTATTCTPTRSAGTGRLTSEARVGRPDCFGLQYPTPSLRRPPLLAICLTSC